MEFTSPNIHLPPIPSRWHLHDLEFLARIHETDERKEIFGRIRGPRKKGIQGLNTEICSWSYSWQDKTEKGRKLVTHRTVKND